MNDSAVSGDSISGNQASLQKTPPKKKRNLAGTPDPDAEVITLSPNTLLATNRFVCEICNKGFQRDQNLQLHRRGHNLPWKLRQRSSNDIKKRVYVCPVSSCVHHHPSRALGDLTGIKKHYCRKHGEKKWKCEKCSKNYAVQSDWKAHSKICGSRDHKCDCGTVFSRRDSLIKHRSYCDALVEDKNTNSVEAVRLSPPSPAAATPPPPVMSSIPEIRSPDQNLSEIPSLTSLTASCSGSSYTNGSSTSNAFTSLFASSTSSETFHSHKTFQLHPPPSIEPTNQGQSIFGSHQFTPSPHPAMSATALLQKAAQMGPAGPSESLLWGLGVVSSSSGPSGLEPDGGLCLSLRCDGGSGLKELMRGSTSMFGPARTTLDLLGLGMAASGGSSGGLAALMTSVGGCIDAVPPFGRDDC